MNSNNHNNIKVDIKIQIEQQLHVENCDLDDAVVFTTQIVVALVHLRLLVYCVSMCLKLQSRQRKQCSTRQTADLLLLFIGLILEMCFMSMRLMERKIAENALILLNCMHIF